MTTLAQAMSEFLKTVEDVTGTKPVHYDASTGKFEQPMDAGQATPDESYDSVRQIECVAGRVAVVTGKSSRVLGPGSVTLIGPSVMHHLHAITSSRVEFSFQ
jgi:hypothetical protein